MLCKECLRVFAGGGFGVKHHYGLASLAKAAADGCYICTPIWESIRAETRCLKGDLETEFDLGRHVGYSDEFPRYPVDEDILDACCVNTYVKEDKGLASGWPKRLDIRRFVAIPTASVPANVSAHGRWSTIPMDQSLQAARKWMSTCLYTHEQCQKHKQPHTYPTRLLELNGHNARLILPSEEELLGPYAALSYCWGPNPSFIRLTADNMRDFRLGIPYSDLPIAFQEAIRYVEGLEIRYLWVDALCIIQSGRGSSEDWQSECGRMQEVYSHCIINISLAQAAHPDQSCMGGYTRETILPFVTELTLRRSSGILTGTTLPYTVIPKRYFEHALYQQPIASRAWVLQERLLATRVLSIGRGELFWDCQEVPNASESLPCGFTLCSKSTREEMIEVLGLKIHSIPRASDTRTLEVAWSKILKEYCARELTYPQVDRLIALSAISSCMSHVLEDTYLAGHFWKMLPQSLNWRAHRGPESDFRTNERQPQRLPKFSSQMLDGTWVITPTWSWASVNGRLKMRTTDASNLTVVAIAEGYRLLPLGENERSPYMENIILLTIRAWCRPIIWTLQESGTKEKVEAWKEECFSNLRGAMDDLNQELEDGSEYLFAVLSHVGHKSHLAEGLLLKETNLYGCQVYERLGQFSGSFYMDSGMTWQSFFTGGERSLTIC